MVHGARAPLGLPTASHSTVPIIVQTAQPLKSDILNYVDKEIIENVDLPGLTPEDIEIVLSENSDWSVEQMERFFHSAIDLSEIEAKLVSTGGYESDSGYSTYDVSPITSSAPLHFNHGAPYSFPSALTPVDPTPPFTLPSSSPSFPLSNVVATSLAPNSASPTPDGGFFSPFTSLAQEGFCTQTCPIFPPFSQPQDYTPAVCFADPHSIPTSVSGFSSEFTELLSSNSTAENPAKLTASEVMSPASHMTGRRSSDGQISAMSYSNGSLDHPGLIEYRSLPDLGKLSNGDPSQQSLQLETISIKQESDPSTSTYACPTNSACAIEGPQVPSPQPTCEDNGINSSYLSNLQLPPNLANLPGSTLQSLLSMCSQMPVLSRLLASSNNPAVFLVAISTALSTLTKPVQGNSNGSSEGETAATNPAVKSEPASAPTLDITQLQSVVAKLGISQLEKMAGITNTTAGHPNSQATASTPPSIPTSQSFTQQMERTVFASVLPNAAEHLPLLPPHAQNGFYFPNGVGIGTSSLERLSCRSVQTGHHWNTKSSPKNVPKRHSVVEMKSKHKKPKQQWPRSMNQANLMAFKEHILNKLKKVQKTGPDTCNQNGGEKSLPSSGKAEASSKPYEHRVTYERNHSSDSRCHSEPADIFCCLTRSPSFSPHLGHSANDVNSTTTSSSKLQMSGLVPLESECSDLLSDFHFNPDALLSSAVLPLPEKMLDELTDTNDHSGECLITDCAMSTDDDKLQQLIEADNTTQAQDTMDIECISDLLSETKSPPSDASSLEKVPTSSVDSLKPEPTSPHASYENQQLYHGLHLSESQKIEVNKAAEALQKTVGTPTYTFPELNSIHGSLDDLRPAEIDDNNSFRMHITENLDSILQTQHDPLIGGSSSSSEPFEI